MNHWRVHIYEMLLNYFLRLSLYRFQISQIQYISKVIMNVQIFHRNISLWRSLGYLMNDREVSYFLDF